MMAKKDKYKFEEQAAAILLHYIEAIDNDDPNRIGDLKHRAIDWFIRLTASDIPDYEADGYSADKYKKLLSSSRDKRRL
jgi:hypothetical protein